jgi:tetratricopeptide (TPR) repeat protein
MRATRAVVVLLACALAIGPRQRAAAQPAPVDRAEARRHYEKGRVAYDLADYGAAIAHFTRAYELSLEPVLIFNIAQAHRLMGSCRKAIELYQRYLRLAPGTEEAETARPHLEALKRSCPEEPPPARAPAASPPRSAAPAAATPLAAATAAPARHRPLRTAAWVGLGAGLLAAAAAPLLHDWNESRKARHEVEAAALARVLPSDAADPAQRTRLEASHRALGRSIDTVDTLVIVTAAAGAALALGSAGYLLFGGREAAPPAPARVTLDVGISPGATLVALSGRY